MISPNRPTQREPKPPFRQDSTVLCHTIRFVEELQDHYRDAGTWAAAGAGASAPTPRRASARDPVSSEKA
jgi:hypothetical protein